MNRCRFTFQVVFVVWVATATATVHAQVWERGVALLKNDRCLDGHIELARDRLVVSKSEGHQVTVPRTQVQYVGKTLEEVYEFKVRSLSANARAGDYYKLAQWCLTNRLLAQAGEQYLKLSQSHPPQNHPSVKRLGSEIKDAMLQQPTFRAYLGMSPLPQGTTVAQNDSMNSLRPALRNSSESQVTTASNTPGMASRLISPHVRSGFVDRVQFILLNRCGQAGCHGPQAGNPFRLDFVTGVDASQKTQANLESVLRYIGDDSSQRSPLIEYATRPHAGRKLPAIASRESHLVAAIENWVAFVQNPVVTAEAVGSSNEPLGLQPVLPGSPQYQVVPQQPGPNSPTADSLPSMNGSSSPNAYPSVDAGAGAFPDGGMPTAEELDQLDALITQQVPFPSQTTNSRDPFDPAEFNRRRQEALR